MIDVLIRQCVELLVTHRVFKRCLELLTCEQSTRIIFNTLEGNYALCLMGRWALPCLSLHHLSVSWAGGHFTVSLSIISLSHWYVGTSLSLSPSSLCLVGRWALHCLSPSSLCLMGRWALRCLSPSSLCLMGRWALHCLSLSIISLSHW